MPRKEKASEPEPETDDRNSAPSQEQGQDYPRWAAADNAAGGLLDVDNFVQLRFARAHWCTRVDILGCWLERANGPYGALHFAYGPGVAGQLRVAGEEGDALGECLGK